MDTRLRNNDGYVVADDAEEPKAHTKPAEAPARKRTAIGGMVLLMALIFGVGCVYTSVTNLWWYSRNLVDRELSERDIVDRSWYIEESLWRYAKNLHRYYVYFGGARYTELPQQEKLTATDLADAKAELATAFEQEYVELTNRVNSDNGNMSYDQKMAAFGELYERFTLSESEIYERAAAAKDANYKDVTDYLSGQTELRYVLRAGGETYSNVPEVTMPETAEQYTQTADFSERYYTALSFSDEVFWRDSFTGVPIAQAFERDSVTGYLFIVRGNPPVQMDEEWKNAANIDYLDDYRPAYLVLLAVSVVFLIITLALALRSIRPVLAANGLMYKLYAFLPFTVKALGATVAAWVLCYEWAHWPIDILKSILAYKNIFNPLVPYMLVLMGMLAFLLITLEYCVITVRAPRTLMREPEVRWFGRFAEDLRYIVRAADITTGLLYALTVAFMLTGITLSVTAGYYEGMVLVLGFAVTFALTFFCHSFVSAYARLVFHIKRMAGGDMSAIPVRRGLFSQTLRQLGKVNEGLSHAVNDMMKSERLKAELITNVSHDLKTPLTSIINYVALLKERPGDNAAAEYIDVLDKKSERLGALIEDLFEASKLQSGSVELARERLDLVDLLNQTLGELGEKITESGLDFRFRHTPEHIYYDCDGKKMWRVFENILVNIIKYSAPNTRAYIEAVKDAGGTRLVFKNISVYELDMPPDELFHRFKRGDAARATDGSGLGLAIARGIVELHGGRMAVEVDGDLFKVLVTLP